MRSLLRAFLNHGIVGLKSRLVFGFYEAVQKVRLTSCPNSRVGEFSSSSELHRGREGFSPYILDGLMATRYGAVLFLNSIGFLTLNSSGVFLGKLLETWPKTRFFSTKARRHKEKHFNFVRLRAFVTLWQDFSAGSLVILLLAFSFADVQAQGSAVGSASLKLTSHARSAALGESDIAERGRFHSFNINPASLAGGDGIEVLLSHNQWIQDVQSEHLSTRLPFSLGTVGLLLSTSSVGGIEIRDRPGLPAGTFSSRAARFQLGFARAWSDNVVIGASIKYLYEKLYVDEATGYGIDLGAIYQIPFDGASVGLSITNIGSMQAFRSTAADLPTTVRFGGSYHFEAPVVSCIVSGAYANDIKGKTSHLQMGLELLHDGFVAGRVGYQTGFETRGLSAGIGIRWTMIDFDYAYVPFSLGLGDAHLFSVGFRF